MQLFQDEEPTKAQLRQAERRDRYATLAAEQLRAARDSQFSLLPFDELARLATNWYSGCTEAMLRGNYGPVEDLVRAQARAAAEQGFTLEDLLILLRQCRTVAIEKDGWNDDQFAEVDSAIDQALTSLCGQVSWEIPEGLSYVTGEHTASRRAAEEAVAAVRAMEVPAEPRERRTHIRNRLRLPIRVTGRLPEGELEEVTQTENVAKGGIYFHSRKSYYKGLELEVTYPYWTTPGAINHSYRAEVVRVDARPDESKGVALKFKVGLGRGSWQIET